ncbi:MAG: hypothetical protein Q4A68_04540 [Anaerobiospirillum succiniciproducens]|uniref:hypothetical protein n=1 Tax=Anaerobiospirillum succiniciproducens TaxID=13335 RepID=UPI0026DB874F|nr:hypothetical protein [Anaerobiospirillum succiniciproducens]MDO4675837.1 hypothetical protein [Anaerobiospirillum succiniciproducens]
MEALLLWLKPNSSAKRKLQSQDIIFSTRKLSYNAKVALHPISQRQKSQSIGQAQANHVAKQKGKRAHKRPIRQAASKKANEHTNDWSIKLHAKANKAWMADRLAKGCGCLIASQKGGGSRKMWLKIGRAQGQLIE